MKEKVTLPATQETKDSVVRKKLHLLRYAFYGQLQ